MSSIIDVLKGIIGNSSTKPDSGNTKNSTVTQTKPAGVERVIKFSSLPKTADQLKAMPEFNLTDPYTVAAMAILPFLVFKENREDCYKMLDALKGPSPLTEREKSFIRDRYMDGKDYIARSYFEGSIPENDYTPALPYRIKTIEYATSKAEPGYIKVFIPSGGADNPRYVTLRNKPSTGEWFVWNFEGLLTGIRIPVSQDKWA